MGYQKILILKIFKFIDVKCILKNNNQVKSGMKTNDKNSDNKLDMII